MRHSASMSSHCCILPWMLTDCCLTGRIFKCVYFRIFCTLTRISLFWVFNIMMITQLCSWGVEVSFLNSLDKQLLLWWDQAVLLKTIVIIVRRAGLLWSQQDFEWRWSVPLFKCLTVLEFSFILFDLCLLITFFNFIMNYVPIVTFWIFTYHKIWILSIMFCFIWSYWIIYFLACLEVSWRVVS